MWIFHEIVKIINNVDVNKRTVMVYTRLRKSYGESIYKLLEITFKEVFPLSLDESKHCFWMEKCDKQFLPYQANVALIETIQLICIANESTVFYKCYVGLEWAEYLKYFIFSRSQYLALLFFSCTRFLFFLNKEYKSTKDYGGNSFTWRG